MDEFETIGEAKQGDRKRAGKGKEWRDNGRIERKWKSEHEDEVRRDEQGADWMSHEDLNTRVWLVEYT